MSEEEKRTAIRHMKKMAEDIIENDSELLDSLAQY